MRIGILTFHQADNYGAVAQAYALMQVLCSYGHDAVIIDYTSEYLKNPFGLKNFRVFFQKEFLRFFEKTLWKGIKMMERAYKI